LIIFHWTEVVQRLKALRYTAMVTMVMCGVLVTVANRRLSAPLSFPEAAQRLHSWPGPCLGRASTHAVEESLRQSPTHTILFKKKSRVAPARSDSSDEALSSSSLLLVDSSDSSQWRPMVGSSRNIRAHEFERPYLPGAGACPPRSENSCFTSLNRSFITRIASSRYPHEPMYALDPACAAQPRT
jgi:hypothetical protein